MYEKIKNLLIEELSINEDSIGMDTALVKDLEMNSLELAEFVLTCEEHFGIVIKDEDLKKLTTVGDIVSYVEKSLNG